MKIALHRGKPASEQDILALEAVLGWPLSAPFRRFIAATDGAELESNAFKVGPDNQSGIDEFIPVAEIPHQRTLLEDLPRHAYPIAWDGCGNAVLIDEEQQGAVFFWDHEQPEPLIRLAANFSEFLESLQPFDPASVQPKPGQVKSAWIDPDFLKSLNQK